MKNNTILIIILVVVFAGVGFFAGMQYQKGQGGTIANQQLGNNPQGGFRRGGQGGQYGAFRPTVGQIVNSDATSITVKMQDGSTKIVLISDKTQFSKTDSATKDDLKNGIEVGVFGTNNSDGSVTAQTIQINPQFGMRNRQPSQTLTPGQ